MQQIYVALEPQIAQLLKYFTVLWDNAQMATVLILAQMPSCLSYQIRVVHLHFVHSFRS